MRFKRLRLENFRRFAHVNIEFAPGLNLIKGPNESGKSTIVKGIVAALFEKPAAATAKQKTNRRWGSDAAPFIELDVTEPEGAYLLIKDFGDGKVTLEQPGGERTLASARAVDTRLQELLGFNSAAQYLRTACVTHDQMVSLVEDAAGAKKIAAMLREVVTGGSESAAMDKAVRALSAEVDELKRGLERPTNNPGTIRRLQEERDVYMRRQKEVSAGATDFEREHGRLDEIEGELESSKERMSDLSSLLDKNSRITEAERKAEAARIQFEESERVMEAADRLEAKDRQIREEYRGFERLDLDAESRLRESIATRESLAGLKSQMEEEAARRAEEALELDDLEEEAPPEVIEEPVSPDRGKLALPAIAGGFSLLVLGVILGMTVHPSLFVLVAPGAVVLALGSYGLARSRAQAAPVQPTVMVSQEREQAAGAPHLSPPDPARVAIDQAEAKAKLLESEEQEILAASGCEDPSEFLAACTGFRQAIAERDNLAAGLKALLGGRTLDEVAAQKRKAALQLSADHEVIEELSPYRLGPDELARRTRERSALDEKIEELERERDGLAFHIQKTASDPDEAIKIEEILNWLWDAEQSARRRLRVHSLAREAMVKASQDLLSSAVPVMAESVSRTFSRLTGGRYSEVEVRESDLAISVFSEELGEMVPADEVLATLSKGTASQLYLSARLHLVDILSGGRRPPLIFDDSFSYFDDRRLEALWQLLVEMSEEQQVLLFTCTDRYDHFAEQAHVIELR